MLAKLGCELWAVREGDDIVLIRPTITNRETGEGVPGIVYPAPRVVKPGRYVVVLSESESYDGTNEVAPGYSTHA